MRITPFLREQAFDPEVLNNMGEAFTQVRKTLGLEDRNDELTERVAREIVYLAQQGVRTKTALYLLTVREFTTNPQ